MSTRAVRIVKVFVFLFCLAPALLMLQQFRTGNLGTDPVASLTHYTGNWAVWMLLTGLAITPLRRLTPKLGWLVRLRRMIGLFAFFYATLHLLTYVFLFSGFDLPGAIDSVRLGHWAEVRQKWLDVWPTLVDDVQKRRFIQVGLLAWTILFALAVTSSQWIMRKMGGRPWQTLHLLVYGAAALAIVHYWWLVKKGNLEPLRDTVILIVLLLARPAWKLVQQWRGRSGSPRRVGSPAL